MTQKPQVGRAAYVQDQQRQVMLDRRTRRNRTRAAQRRRALTDYNR
jgi:hypothetical protein